MVTGESTFGSPPHAWGHFPVHVELVLAFRFTPTRVGTLSPETREPQHSTVHPHTRGDIVAFFFSHGHPVGSPPHAWGHCTADHSDASTGRFTPTRVGTFCESGLLRVRASVHPHTRGDIVGAAAAVPLWCGSPPHAWGHSLLALDAADEMRFTPTRVGTL